MTLTLWLQSAGIARAHAWVRRALEGDMQHYRRLSLCRVGCAIDNSRRCPARDGDSAVGMLLSLAVPTVMGLCDLLLREQLFHARL